MIGLVVTGHGNFATGVTTSLNFVAGPAENYVPVDFEESDSMDTFRDKLIAAYDSLSNCDSILVLADLVGATPFKTAVETGYPRGNVEVIGGINLGMLLEINITRSYVENAKELADSAITIGRNHIIRFELPQVQPQDDFDDEFDDDDFEDGI